MNLTLSLSLTQKGIDEVKGRVYKLNMKKRSVLLLLERPQTAQYVLDKAVFDKNELIDEIAILAREGFILVGDSSVALASAAVAGGGATPPPKTSFSELGFYINNEIILSEGRFLLVNFCLDNLGTGAQQYVDSLGACKSVEQFAASAKQVYELIKTKFPQHFKALEAVLDEVNQTAD